MAGERGPLWEQTRARWLARGVSAELADALLDDFLALGTEQGLAQQARDQYVIDRGADLIAGGIRGEHAQRVYKPLSDAAAAEELAEARAAAPFVTPAQRAAARVELAAMRGDPGVLKVLSNPFDPQHRAENERLSKALELAYDPETGSVVEPNTGESR